MPTVPVLSPSEPAAPTPQPALALDSLAKAVLLALDSPAQALARDPCSAATLPQRRLLGSALDNRQVSFYETLMAIVACFHKSDQFVPTG